MRPSKWTAFEITDDDNTIDDIIPGVTLKLIKEDSGDNHQPERQPGYRFHQEHDPGIREPVQYRQKLYQYPVRVRSGGEKTGGVLFGDGTLHSVKTDLVTKLTQTVWGVNCQFSSLGMVGINMDNSGILSINDVTLSGFLRTHFSDVESLFIANGISSSNVLSYVCRTRDTQEGEYAVHIDRASVRASETGNVDLSAGGAGETLTITQGKSVAAITITSGMTIADIVNAVNTEFSAESPRPSPGAFS